MRNRVRNVTQFARKYDAATNITRSVCDRPMPMARWFAHLVVTVSTIAVPTATIQNGSVSFSRFGLPLRSQAHRDRT